MICNRSSSNIIKSYCSNCFCIEVNVLLDLHSLSLLINVGVLVKSTLNPSLHACIPNPIAICVFPVPGLPAKIKFCPLLINSKVFNTCNLF